jgi:hypothetical protein
MVAKLLLQNTFFVVAMGALLFASAGTLNWLHRRNRIGEDCDDAGRWKESLVSNPALVIPGRAKREPGIHTHDRGYGFRARPSDAPE